MSLQLYGQFVKMHWIIIRGGSNIYVYYLVHKWSGHSVVCVHVNTKLNIILIKLGVILELWNKTFAVLTRSV